MVDIAKRIRYGDGRTENEVADYIEQNMDEVAMQIAFSGTAKIPTSSGDYTLTEAVLIELADAPDEEPDAPNPLARTIGSRADHARRANPRRE